MTKIVRFTDVTFGGDERCFPNVDFGRHSMAVVTREHNEPPFKWRFDKVICCPDRITGIGLSSDAQWLLMADEVEDVTQDEVDTAIAYQALMGGYVAEI